MYPDGEEHSWVRTAKKLSKKIKKEAESILWTYPT